MFGITKLDKKERGKVYYLKDKPDCVTWKVVVLRIKYSTDSDILLMKFRERVPVDSLDATEGLIAHFGEDGKLLEIEVLDASKFKVCDINELNFSFEKISALKTQNRESRVCSF